jgi:hypothetical protein
MGISVEALSDELGCKGQELRDMTRDLDLLKLDVDVIAMMVRLRGAPVRASGSLCQAGLPKAAEFMRCCKNRGVRTSRPASRLVHSSPSCIREFFPFPGPNT